VGISEMLTDLKSHLEHGEQLLASHVPALVEWATKAESDPLVQAALNLAVGPETKAMLATFLKNAEAEFQRVEADATAKAAEAAAAAAQPAADPPAEEPAA
jgi:hypothetical protein